MENANPKFSREQEFVGTLVMPSDVRFEAVRRFVRDQLNDCSFGKNMNKLSAEFLMVG